VPTTDFPAFGPTRTVASKSHVQVSFSSVAAILGLAWNTSTHVTSTQRVAMMGVFFMGYLLSGPMMV
jgi:hypothetical protein